MSDESREEEFSQVIGNVLRFGVIIATAIILVGCVLLFSTENTGYYSIGSAEQLFDRHNKFLIGFVPLVQGVIALKPYAIIELGLIVLLATPITRVVISIFMFAEQKRYVFVLITTAVLVILLTSTFILGPLLA